MLTAESTPASHRKGGVGGWAPPHPVTPCSATTCCHHLLPCCASRDGPRASLLGCAVPPQVLAEGAPEGRGSPYAAPRESWGGAALVPLSAPHQEEVQGRACSAGEPARRGRQVGRQLPLSIYILLVDRALAREQCTTGAPRREHARYNAEGSRPPRRSGAPSAFLPRAPCDPTPQQSERSTVVACCPQLHTHMHGVSCGVFCARYFVAPTATRALAHCSSLCGGGRAQTSKSDYCAVYIKHRSVKCMRKSAQGCIAVRELEAVPG